MHLIENVKQGNKINYMHFIEAMPADGLIYLKSLVKKRNVIFNYFYLYSENQIPQLLQQLCESKENNEWLFIELSFYSNQIFKKLDYFINSLEEKKNSLHSFQIFIISPPNLKIFDIIPMKYRESLKYYQLKIDFPLSFTISKFLLCFENFLEFKQEINHYQFEELIRIMMHSSVSVTMKKIALK